VTLKFFDWLFLLIFGCFVFLYFRGIDAAAGRNPLDADVIERKLLLFVLDFQDFSCMTCLDSFLALCRQLPLRTKTQNTWGILVLKNTENDGNSRVQIAEKKLRGFIQANRIDFPILTDKDHCFERLTQEGSAILLFDGSSKSIRRYHFPLGGYQFEEIFEILNN
jgi:hypothetical protein